MTTPAAGADYTFRIEVYEREIFRIGRMLRSRFTDRDHLAPERSQDVRLHEFMRDELGTARKIYTHAGTSGLEDLDG
jgi:hypothetical protein